MVAHGSGHDEFEQEIRRGYSAPPPGDELAASLEARLRERLRVRAGSAVDECPQTIRVRRTALRRAAVWLSAAAAVIAAAGLGLWLSGRGGTPAAPNTGDRGTLTAAEVAELKARVAWLDREADAALLAARLMTDRERQRRRLGQFESILARPDPLVVASRQVDHSAEVLVKQADEMVRRHKLTRPAVETYRQVATLFAGSGWAEVARRRLTEIEKG